MSHISCGIVQHESGWAYTVNGVYSEPFAPHASALAADLEDSPLIANVAPCTTYSTDKPKNFLRTFASAASRDVCGPC